ncbi:MAG: type II toxin-antitoxin system YafQ family toxin [Treponema sp.]|jgi:mRNA-degrading endonuclease YafQ of YafQ-DinJ toxin-antitoxin module|nr:type II toxin-antitoxin system YafQ family toxin [Treponema sp.]
MLEIEFSGRMKQDLKRMVRRGKNPEKLTEILDMLANFVPLAPRHRDHPTAARTGSHADFGW